MTTCFLAPDPVQSTFFIPGGNTPGNGVQVFFYAAGSSTKQTVYKDPAAAVSWTNPIVLDSGGNLPSGGEVWFAQGNVYKVVWAPSNDSDPPASPYRTMDNLSGINDTSAGSSEWVASGTPTFVNASTFTLLGDQTAAGNAESGRRMRFTVTAGTVYGVIVSATFGGVVTTVVMNMTNGVLDAGLSAAFYGFTTAVNPSVAIQSPHAKAANVSSASTTNVWSNGGDLVHITGSTTIGSFGTAINAGQQVTVIADGNFTLIGGTNLIFPGTATSLSVSSGDSFEVVSDTASKAVITGYLPATVPVLSFANHGQVRLDNFPGSTGILLMVPYNGNKLVINSVVQTVPDAGVTLTASGLTANQTYYIYAAVSSGSMFLEGSSSTAYTTQSGTGIKIKTGDASRTLVGLEQSATNSTWVGYCRSWFNDPGATSSTPYTTNASITSNIYAELATSTANSSRAGFLVWANEIVQVSVDGWSSQNNGSQATLTALAIDSVIVDAGAMLSPTGGAATSVIAMSAPISGLAEGFHYVSLFGRVTAGTGTWFGSSVAPERVTMKTYTQWT